MRVFSAMTLAVFAMCILLFGVAGPALCFDIWDGIYRSRGPLWPTNRVERRLATILATDVAGYSRLMGADEEGVLARLQRYR
jgi:hypothetical protein